MNRREQIQTRIGNLKGLENHLIRINERDLLREVRRIAKGLERELEGMKRTNRYYN